MADLQSTKLVAVAASVSPYDQWVLGAGADKVSAVNSADDATSFISANTAGRIQLYTLNPAAIAGASRVHSISVRLRGQTPSGAGDCSIQYGWAYLSYQQFAQADLTPVWTTYDLAVTAVNPLTGLPWTVAEVGNIVIGVISNGAGTSDRRASLLNLVAVVTFESVAALQCVVQSPTCAGAALNFAIKRTILTSASSGQLQAVVRQAQTLTTALHAGVRHAVVTGSASLQTAVRKTSTGPSASLQAQVQGVVPGSSSASLQIAVRKSSTSPRAYLEARVTQYSTSPPAALRAAVIRATSSSANAQALVVVRGSVSANLQTNVQKKGSPVGGAPSANMQSAIAQRWQPTVSLVVPVKGAATPVTANLQAMVVVRTPALATLHCAVLRPAKSTSATLHARVTVLTPSGPANLQVAVRRTISTEAALHALVVLAAGSSTALHAAVSSTLTTTVALHAAVGSRGSRSLSLQAAVRSTLTTTAVALHAWVSTKNPLVSALHAAVRRSIQVVSALHCAIAVRTPATAVSLQCAVAVRSNPAANAQCAVVTRVRVTGVPLHAQVSAVVPVNLRANVTAANAAAIAVRAFVQRTSTSGSALLSVFVLAPTPHALATALHAWLAVRSTLAVASLQCVVVPSGKYVSCDLHAHVVAPPSTDVGSAGQTDASSGAP